MPKEYFVASIMTLFVVTLGIGVAAVGTQQQTVSKASQSILVDVCHYSIDSAQPKAIKIPRESWESAQADPINRDSLDFLITPDSPCPPSNR